MAVSRSVSPRCKDGFAMTGAFAAGLLLHAPFAYAALAVWRYFWWYTSVILESFL